MIFIEGEGWKHTEETKLKMRLYKGKGKGHPHYGGGWILGKHHTSTSIEKMKLAHKGQAPFKGHHHREETLEKLREACKGEKSYRWLGGISYFPYCSKFNKKLKEEIRNKYRRKCFLCGKSELENDGKRMCVHHVDYDKEQGCNGKTFELVPLCRSCHAKTNGERDKYKIIIINKLRTINDCY